MSVIRFTKMQGLGNDYIYVNVMEYPISNPEQFSIRWSDRRKGIGSDGLIMIGKSAIADFSMRIFNADGSEARMCGNGARCVGKYLHDKGLTSKTEIRLDTLSGIKILNLHLGADGKVDTVTVNMGKGLPLKVNHGDGTLVGEKLNVGEGPTICSAIDMGNPHLVMFVKDAEKAHVSEVGPFMEHNAMFPDRANIEFAQVLDRKHIRMRVWERGAGETLACGTGACATAVAAILNGLTEETVDVELLGGHLEITFDRELNTVFMTGPATVVLTGEIDLPESFEKDDDVKIYSRE